jgi:hypothetical protein
MKIAGMLKKANISWILDLEKIAESKYFSYYSNNTIISEVDLRKNDKHLDIVWARMWFPAPKDKINYLYLWENKERTTRSFFPMIKDNLVVSDKSFDPHEIAHFLVQKNMWFSHPVLNEWIAVLNWWWAIEWSCLYDWRRIDEWIKIFEEVNILPTLEELFTDFAKYPQDRSHPVSAYIVRNILQNYWTAFFKRFFVSIKNDMSFGEVSTIFEEMTHQKFKDIY